MPCPPSSYQSKGFIQIPSIIALGVLLASMIISSTIIIKQNNDIRSRAMLPSDSGSSSDSSVCNKAGGICHLSACSTYGKPPINGETGCPGTQHCCGSVSTPKPTNKPSCISLNGYCGNHVGECCSPNTCKDNFCTAPTTQGPQPTQRPQPTSRPNPSKTPTPKKTGTPTSKPTNTPPKSSSPTMYPHVEGQICGDATMPSTNSCTLCPGGKYHNEGQYYKCNVQSITRCGDSSCNGLETCLSCPGDCGKCKNGIICTSGNECLSGYCDLDPSRNDTQKFCKDQPIDTPQPDCESNGGMCVPSTVSCKSMLPYSCPIQSFMCCKRLPTPTRPANPTRTPTPTRTLISSILDVTPTKRMATPTPGIPTPLPPFYHSPTPTVNPQALYECLQHGRTYAECTYVPPTPTILPTRAPTPTPVPQCDPKRRWYCHPDDPTLLVECSPEGIPTHTYCTSYCNRVTNQCAKHDGAIEFSDAISSPEDFCRSVYKGCYYPLNGQSYCTPNNWYNSQFGYCCLRQPGTTTGTLPYSLFQDTPCIQPHNSTSGSYVYYNQIDPLLNTYTNDQGINVSVTFRNGCHFNSEGCGYMSTAMAIGYLQNTSMNKDELINFINTEYADAPFCLTTLTDHIKVLERKGYETEVIGGPDADTSGGGSSSLNQAKQDDQTPLTQQELDEAKLYWTSTSGKKPVFLAEATVYGTGVNGQIVPIEHFFLVTGFKEDGTPIISDSSFTESNPYAKPPRIYRLLMIQDKKDEIP